MNFLNKTILGSAISLGLLLSSNMAFAQEASQGTTHPSNDMTQLRQSAEEQAKKIMDLTASGADESVLLREVSRYQAQLSLLKVASEIEKTKQDMETERLKFQVEQAKSNAELNSAKRGGMNAATQSMGMPNAMSMPDGSMPKRPMSATEKAMDVKLVSVYSFGSKRLAEFSSDEFGVVTLESGGRLPSGATVEAIDSNSALLKFRGKTKHIHLSAGKTKEETK